MTTRRSLTGKRKKNPEACPPMAILDWGIGGLGLFKLLRSSRPDVAVTYFSDSGEVPYGRLSKQQLISRLGRILDFLGSFGVTHLVIACNAMSTVLPLPGQTGKRAVLITGVIAPTLEALSEEGHERFAIVGGRRTILSGAYRKGLRKAGKTTRQRIAQPLSRLIEDGRKDSALFSSTLRKIVQPLKNSEALILGCTHYSAALDQFTSLLPGAVIVDPAVITLAWIERNWTLPAGEKRKDVFFTTGSVPGMRTAARRAFEIELGEIRKLNVALGKYD